MTHPSDPSTDYPVEVNEGEAKALRDAPSPSGSEAWRPISTAPKTGEPILAYNPVVGVYNTAYTTRWTIEVPDKLYEGFPCGFWLDFRGGYPFGKWDCQPTHWMPLPPPPRERFLTRPQRVSEVGL
jgi:hypothetical protein